jgi:hypothetical protein
MKMSNYCKAYTADRFRQFEGWTEAAQNARPDDSTNDEVEAKRPRVLTDASVLYLHDSFVVTDGICLDEGVIFDAVTPEWRRFCTERLEFRVPEELQAAQGGNGEPPSGG